MRAPPKWGIALVVPGKNSCPVGCEQAFHSQIAPDSDEPVVVEKLRIEGEIVDVDDAFVVNPDVWEVVRRSPDGRDVVVLPHPAKGGTRRLHVVRNEGQQVTETHDSSAAPTVETEARGFALYVGIDEATAKAAGTSLAAIVGATLSLSGASYQGVFRNPLEASP